nr:uncharacterized protein LOC111847335 [Paramormyrops kingsleyae]
MFSVSLGCSAALVTQTEVMVVKSGENATLPCGISVHEEVSWFSLQSDHKPARITDLQYTSNKMSLVNTKDVYRERLTAVSVSDTHSLELKNITKADLLIYCCIQKKDHEFGNCTKLKFNDHPGGQSTPHHLQTLKTPDSTNPDLLPWILLPCVALLTAPLRKSSESQQKESRTSRHDQEKPDEVQYVSVKFKSPKKRDQKRGEDAQDTVYAGIK